MSERVLEALRIAVIAHEGQRDKGGNPYLLHPIRVADLVKTEDEKVLALLHDTVEDAGVSLEDVRERFGAEIAEALDHLTHRDGESYSEYLGRVIENPLAARVKLADLRDNMDLTRLERPTERDFRREKKYADAMYRIAMAISA